MKQWMLVMAVCAACGHGAVAPADPGSGGSSSAGGSSASGSSAGADASKDPFVLSEGPEAPSRRSTDTDAGVAPIPDAAPRKPPPPKGVAKVVQLNDAGVMVDIDQALPAGYVTIVDFWATWCGGCKIIEAKFMEKIEPNAKIVVRKVDVGDGDTPVAKHYKVHGLPQVWIYDAKKRLRYVLVANDALKAGDIALGLVAEASGNVN